jgi:predicted aspartyl protease
MGVFRTDCKVAHISERDREILVPGLLVDTGSECTWIPEKTLESIGVAREKKDLQFVMANGQVITRSIGFVILRVEPHFTVDEVVFAEEGDLLLLGARTLEGLNLTVDLRQKKLVASGPRPAASVSRS